MALVSGDCTFCAGSGKCEECNGTRVNPHLNSSEPECSHCFASGVCPECDGTGKTPMWRPRNGKVLVYGAAWAIGLIAFFGSLSFVTSRWIVTVLLIAWSAFWYVLFYRDSQRRKPAPGSRL